MTSLVRFTLRRAARLGRRALFLVVLLGLAPIASAFDFPPITDEERALTEHGGASAVILHEEAQLHFRDFVREASSRLEVTVRVKILGEEGISQGEILIPHNRMLRLDRVEARTVRPDGSVVPVTEDAVFRDQISAADKAFVTKIVFPQVEVGSILDYHYVFYWDTMFYLEPWVFHGRLPKMRSSITYFKPDRMGVRFWVRETTANKIDVQQQKTAQGHEVTGTLTDIAAMPDEPYSYPLDDVATRMLLYPDHVNFSGQRVLLMTDWREVCDQFEDGYTDFRKKDRQAKKLAKELASAAGRDDRARAEAIYRHVRDEVRTVDRAGVWLLTSEADDVLKNGQGADSDQAVLLQTLLQAADIDARLVWADNRYRDGRAVLEVPNPAFFDRVLVAVTIDGERIFLDPSDSTLAFGRLQPHFEGTQALLVHERDPETIEIPESRAKDNLRRSEMALEIDEEGRAHGTGTLALHGHSAWRRIGVDDDPAAAWAERLEEAHPGFAVEDVQVEEDAETARLDVSFALRQRDEAVLGDEVSLGATGYLALEQPFPHDPAERVTPVMMLHPRRDEVRWKVTYPEGWEVDVLPASTNLSGSEGYFTAEYEADVENRTISFERTFERHTQDILGKKRYRSLQLLYRVASASDARTVELYAP